MKFSTIILLFILSFTSCSRIDIFGYEDLGANYFLWEEDHYQYSIIWTDKPARDGGTLVTDMNERVIQYNYNSRYIIFKTIEYKPSGMTINKFCLIDKSVPIDFEKREWKTSIITGSIDSINFLNI